MGEKFRRGFIIFMVVLFAATSLGVGIWGFIAATRQESNDTNQEETVTPENRLQGKPLDNFTPVAKIEKLEVTDTQPGTGQAATKDSTIIAHYTGAVASTGIIFQSSLDSGQPFSTKLDAVIKGWQDGIPGMKAGGQRRLLIPAADAYGNNPPSGSGIPAGADLVFDIVLISVE